MEVLIIQPAHTQSTIDFSLRPFIYTNPLGIVQSAHVNFFIGAIQFCYSVFIKYFIQSQHNINI